MWKFIIILAIFVVVIILICFKSNKRYKSFSNINKDNYVSKDYQDINIENNNNNQYKIVTLDKIEEDYEYESCDDYINYDDLKEIKNQKNKVQYQIKSVYDNLLHNPKWLSCRKRILERDNHKCQWCGSDKYLQIHHKYYCKLPNNKLVNPWEYKEDCFMTLCKSCHEKLHQKYKNKVYYRSYGEQIEILSYIKKLNKQ